MQSNLNKPSTLPRTPVKYSARRVPDGLQKKCVRAGATSKGTFIQTLLGMCVDQRKSTTNFRKLRF